MFAAKVNTLPAVQTLVNNGAAIEMTDFKGRNALHHASEGVETKEIAQYLIEHGLDPSALDAESNCSGVHLAAKSGNLKVLKLFHNLRIPIDEFNSRNFTPFMLAALHKHHNNVEFLIDKVDIFKKSDYLSPFECALISKEYIAIVESSTLASAFAPKREHDIKFMGNQNKIINLFIQNGIQRNPKVSPPSNIKNAATILFESIVHDIDKVKFKHIYNESGWEKIVVIKDEKTYPLLEIFREVQWEKISLSETDYNTRLSKLTYLKRWQLDHIDSEIQSERKLKLEPLKLSPEDLEAMNIYYQEKYKNLNNFDKYILHAYTEMLFCRRVNEVLAGDHGKPESDLHITIANIAFIANALNKIEPEQKRQFLCRGQADRFKEYKSPIFISLTNSFYTGNLYATIGHTVEGVMVMSFFSMMRKHMTFPGFHRYL